MPLPTPGKTLVIMIKEIHVAEWSKDPVPGRTPPTEVHLIITAEGGILLVMRLKSARACDELIDALTEHRAGVFGPRPVTCPDCDGSGEVAGEYFADDGMTTCQRCGGKGEINP